MDKVPDRYTGEVYRGRGFDEDLLNKYQDAFKNKQLVSEGVFLSTTKNKSKSFPGEMQFIIKTKNSASISSFSGASREEEILIKPSSKFKVRKITKGKFDTYLIQLEEID